MGRRRVKRRGRYGSHLPWHQNLARFLFDLVLIGAAWGMIVYYMHLVAGWSR